MICVSRAEMFNFGSFDDRDIQITNEPLTFEDSLIINKWILIDACGCNASTSREAYIKRAESRLNI